MPGVKAKTPEARLKQFDIVHELYKYLAVNTGNILFFAVHVINQIMNDLRLEKVSFSAL